MGFLGYGTGAQSFADSFMKVYQFDQQQQREKAKLAEQERRAKESEVYRNALLKMQQDEEERKAAEQAGYVANRQGMMGAIGNAFTPAKDFIVRGEDPTTGEMQTANVPDPAKMNFEQAMTGAIPYLDQKTAPQFDALMKIRQLPLDEQKAAFAQMVQMSQIEKNLRKPPQELMRGPDGTMVPKVEGAAGYDTKETWSEPYEANIGGKKALVQKSTHGQVRPVLSDRSTTTTINMQMPSSEEVEVVAQLLADGKITMNDISKRGGVKQQAAILKRAAELNPSLDPRADQAATSAFASSLTMQQRQLGMMGSFVKNMDYQVGRVKDLADELKTFDSRIMNVPLRAVRSKIAGSPLQAKYDMYITEIENEIGKLATGSAASISELSVGAQEKWAKIHDKNLSVKDMVSLLEETSKAGKMRMKSVQDQLSETKTQMRGRGNAPEQERRPSAPMSTLPAAEQNRGRVIRRSDGIRLKSDGTKWTIVR